MTERHEQLLPYLIIASMTVLALISFTSVADVLIRAFVDRTFHVSEGLFWSLATLEAGLLLGTGVTIVRRNGQ